MYGPVRDYLVDLGYTVRGEVRNCDITAVKGDDLIIVELKRRFSTDIIFQAIDRQSIADSVYIALPGPVQLGRKSKWRKIILLLRRLELGLIAVNPGHKSREIEIICHPEPYQRRKLKKKKRALLDEMNQRSGDYNKGGSTRKKLITAYRENAVLIACRLLEHGPLSPKQLREMGTGPKTGSILYNNHYKWFIRVERGIYALTAQGRQDLESYPELTENHKAEK